MPIKASSRWEKVRDWMKPGPEAELRSVLEELRGEGKKILGLTGGDPPAWGFINQPLSKNLIEAAEQGYHTYSGKANDQGLRASPSMRSQLQNAIAAFEKRERNVDFNPSEIFPCSGCGGALTAIHYAMLEDGDEIVVVEPSHYLGGPAIFFSYLNAKTVQSRSKEEDGWQPDLEELREKISDRTKAIMIINPNNPTGAVYDEKTLKALVNIAGECDIPILSDEIYGLFDYDEIEVKSTAAVAGDVPVIVINGMSKIFMRTGWRVGYVAFNDPEGKIKEIIDTTRKVWGLYGHQAYSMPVPIMYAATKAYEGSLDAGREMVRELRKHRDYVMKRIDDIDELSCVEPKGSYYVFPHVGTIGAGKTWKSDVDFLTDLAKEEQVTFIPGRHYGEHGHGHFRMILLPKIEILEDVYNRIERFMAKNIT